MLKRVLVGVIFVPLLILLILLPPKWVFTCVVAVIAALAAWELIHASARLTLPLYCLTALAAAIVPFLMVGRGTWIALVAFLLFSALFFAAVRAYDSDRAIRYEDLFAALFAGIIMPLFLSALVYLMGEEHGRILVMFTIGLAFITDAGAYFAGMLLGKHRGITRVSPNKSLEGFLGGLVTGVIYALIFGLVVRYGLHFHANLVWLMVTGLLGGCFTELGDLSFSLIKRECGVKDYGNLLPGHGGMMDRFDSMVFCAPLVLLFHMIFSLF